MKRICLIFTLMLVVQILTAQIKTIHTYVALCDNENQGIVPVPEKLGNGKDPRNNLYWGAAYGIKSYFKYKASEWELVKIIESDAEIILERVLFKHVSKPVYMLADAYNGERIKDCIEDFLKAANGQQPTSVDYDSIQLNFGGAANLLAYIGHDGLMEFNAAVSYEKNSEVKRDVIMLACYSKDYFSPEIKGTGSNPLLWTTGLMAPEAYTLKAALDGWILNETNLQIEERAAQAYHKYQKCGINGARNLFTEGF